MSAAVVLVLLSGCSGFAGSQKPINETLETKVRSAVAAIGCQRSYFLWDDMYNYPDMRGAVCYLSAGESVNIRAYNTAAEADSALVDWPISPSVLSIMRNGGTFIAGPSDVLTQVNKAIPEFGTPTASLGHLTPADDELRHRSDCVQLVTSTITNFVLQPYSFEDQRLVRDAAFPGLSDFIESLVTAGEADKLRTTMASHDVLYESEISVWGSEVKNFCLDAVG